MTIGAGRPYPLGATPVVGGVNFAVWSEVAERIDVCLFDDAGRETRHRLPEVTDSVHPGLVAGVDLGQRYGLRAYGPWAPEAGLRCNPAKLLIDPYAKAICGPIEWGREVYGHRQGLTHVRDGRDSARFMPKAVVVDPTFDWGDDARPDTALEDSIIYETHVRGMTLTHPDVDPALRGTYAGLASPPIIDYLTALGVTAIELLPVHHFLTEHSVVERGLTNYWGYNTVGFFAPHGPYAAAGDGGGQVNEFRAMVKSLHAAGIEVLLDVVYNHSAEGNHLGPSLSLKGLDNRAYYHLDPTHPAYYVDYSGTGNTLNMARPEPLRLMMDSLRYWVTEMRVDGFRFDLAAALTRGLHQTDRQSAFFDVIHQDPVLSRVKLIAEPWDIGPDGYQVGNFPQGWSEWNGRFRDGVRDYWRGGNDSLSDFASRLTGSSDLYGWSGRRPSASINFVTAHDGFTLADLVAYDHKHNEANHEDNRDGDSHNRSWNSGHEGVTTDPAILQVRQTRSRSLLASLILAQGVPMLLGGDEFGRTQGGNNNGYAQDNEVSWFDWSSTDDELTAFVQGLIALRKRHRLFRRRSWFHGRARPGATLPDLGWYRPDGRPMTDADWDVHYARAVAVFLNGDVAPRSDQDIRGELPNAKLPGTRGQHFLLLFNASPDDITFVVPEALEARAWPTVFDTANARGNNNKVEYGKILLDPWAAVALTSGF